jgi:plasmid stabilization system protein ParE
MRVEFHPAAQQEVENAQSWYAERSVFAAAAFLQEISLAVQRVREAPLRHPSAERGTRKLLVDTFPFTLYYRVGPEVVSIVAVAHQKRRPGYWSSR